MTSNERNLLAAVAMCAAVASPGCITIERADESYPAAPQGATEVIHVATSGDDEAAGTAAAPLRTISAALQAAPTGAAIVIASGDYPEELSITRSVTLVGGGGTDVQVGVPGLAVALHVSGSATDARIEGVYILGAVTASGIIKEATLVMDDCIVHGGDVELDLNEGLGLVVAQGGTLILNGGQVGGHAGTGIIAWEGSVEVHGTLVASNGLGGVMAQDATEPTVIDQATITGNKVFGVAAMGADLVLTRTLIELTLGFGDGVLAAGSETRGAGEILVGGEAACAIVAVDECANEIRDNQRFGVLINGASGGVFGNLVSGNGSGGVWVQHGDTTVDVSGNTIAGNGMVGVAIAANATCNVVDNTIETTRAILAQLGSDDFGDGVAVLDGAVALVDGNTIRGSDRAGVFLSWVGNGTTLGLNTFEDNEADVVCQGDLTCGGASAMQDGPPGSGGGDEATWTEVQDEGAAAPDPSYAFDAAGGASTEASDVISEDEDEDE